MNLYHYTSAQGVEGIINSSSLHCTNIMFLNDPSEHSYFDGVLADVVNREGHFGTIHKSLFNTSFRENVIQPTEQYVGSFSENPDSLSMWNYYSKGDGYNLELDVDSMIKDAQKANNDISIRRIEIVYDRSEQLKIVDKFFREFEKPYSTYREWQEKIKGGNNDYDFEQEAYDNTSGIEADFTEGVEELSVSLKHSAYEREEEVRLIIARNPAKDFSKTFRLSRNGVFIEYFPLPLDVKRHIKSVTIHPLNSTLHRDGLERFLEAKIGYRKVPIKMSTIPFRVV